MNNDSNKTDGNILAKILWFVRYGPDASHMWDAKSFTKLREAREFAKDLPVTPTGGVRPFVIERYEYISDNVYGDIIRVREVKNETT